MPTTDSREELQRVLSLLDLEREEDLAHYQNLLLRTPLTERRRQGTSWYPVVVTESGFGTGGNLFLEVEKTSDQLSSAHFQPGRPVSLFSNATGGKGSTNFLNGTITAARPRTLRIAFRTDDLPDWIDDGKLGVDLLFDETSYQEMRAAVNLVLAAKGNRLAELREILLGHQPPRFRRPDPPAVAQGLNDSQRRAVDTVLAAEDVAILHGPPGTGKTTTLVVAVAQTLQRENQVLVCAPSNTAVDLLTEKLAARGLSVLRLGNPGRVSEELQRFTLDARIAADKHFPRIRQLRRQADEHNRLAHQYKRSFGSQEREQRQRAVAEARSLSKEADALEKYLVESQLNGAQVITATLVGAANRLLRGRHFSTVFIDEAAQALEPATWIPVTKADRVVFAGDHQQLPPTVKSAKAAAAGLGQTLFEKGIQRTPAGVLLPTQYRMHAQIMQFSNEQFYQNQLRADDSVKEAVLGEGDYAEPPVEFIDTAGCGFEEQPDAESGSIANPDEARLLFRHLSAFWENLVGFHPALLTPTLNVGLISPYKAQVETLKTLFAQQPPLAAYAAHFTIQTIDGFQGQEREVVYISLVRSNGKNEIGFLRDLRRMNVALTRARKKLVVIGDSATLSAHPFYRAFLDYVDRIGAYRSAWEFE
ncbi:MAG: AAA family ATPase [Ferruginibacter sp.]|nr:AAA family ATPase [Cytophagales bacterium]